MGVIAYLWAKRQDVQQDLAEVDGALMPLQADSMGALRVHDKSAATLGTPEDAAIGDVDGTINGRLRQIAKTLDAVEIASAPLVDTWPKAVVTGASALIATGLAALDPAMAFPAGTFKIALVPHDTTIPIYMQKTTATNASAIIPAGGISFVVTKTVADLLAVYSASTNSLSVYVCQA